MGNSVDENLPDQQGELAEVTSCLKLWQPLMQFCSFYPKSSVCNFHQSNSFSRPLKISKNHA